MPTALLSVYDKSRVAELAEGLHAAGWRLLSSGGTAREIAAHGVPVTDVAELTGMPAILGHRVVTLHPKVHGGILADTSDPSHRADLAEFGIEPIDLVVVNLYPFATEPGIELIDIGGPAMVRAAAKNHDRVAVVVDPADYDVVLAEIRADGGIAPATRRALARKAFATTAAYDSAIAAWLAADIGEPSMQESAASAHQSESDLPETLRLSLTRAQALRYGENPHQVAARYRLEGERSWWDAAVQHGGKELSYLNLYDSEAAWRLVHRFAEPACVIVKHANPCGVAVAADIAEAYVRANACDPVSAFGGIVAVNRTVTAAMAKALAPVFTEVVVAPDFEPEALTTLTAKRNLRVLTATEPGRCGSTFGRSTAGCSCSSPIRSASIVRRGASSPRSVPIESQWPDLEFAWIVCAAVSSNAIVFANDRQAVGIGAGQQNRLDSAAIAATRAGDRAAGGVCASDAFFPFRDGLDTVAAAGIAAVIQPGGSVRDDDVIAAADEHGIAMVFTGERHFRH